MKKSFLLLCSIAITLIMVYAGCGITKQKAAIIANPHDTLKIYLDVLKMEAKAFAMQQHGLYDSALAGYNKCLYYLNEALAENNNKGLFLYATELIEINQDKGIIYDSIGQPENSIRCTFESIHWAKRIGDNAMQIKFDLHVADKLKNMAIQVSGDTAKTNSFLREALSYAIASNRVIDSLRTKDMDDSRYEGFHLTSKIYALLGDEKQAQLFDKKYRDVYYGIFKTQPPADN